MGSKKLPAVILVLAMTATMVSLSTTAAGTHARTVEISPMYARPGVSVKYTLTVTNTSGDPINNVRIVLPGGFSGPKSLVLLPEGSEVELLGENLVNLPATTEAKVTLDNEIKLWEFSTVMLPEDDMIYIPGVEEHVISNESFESSTEEWSFVTAAGTPTGSWDPDGWKNGGCAKIASETGANMDGAGYWKQTFAMTIAPASTVALSYRWKKGYAEVAPDQQDIYVTIVKPDTTTVNIDSQLGAPSQYNTWKGVTEDVSAFFDQDGTYVIRLRYDYKTGADASAQALAWFDEVKLVVTPPALAKYLLLNDERAELVADVRATLEENTRIELLMDTGGYLADDSVILLADTPMSLIDYQVLEDTGAKLPAKSTARLKGGIEVAVLESTRTILLDNHVRLRDNTLVFQLEPVADYTTLPEDTAVELEENEVILKRTNEGEFAENNTITLPEDTAITIGAGTTVSLPPATVANIIRVPEGWTPVVDNVANTITWTGIGENAIAAGKSESFIFSAQTPDITDMEDTYGWTIVTTDTVGQSESSTFDTIVDGKKPEIDAVYLNDRLENAYLAAGHLATLRVTMKDNEPASRMRRVFALYRYVIMSTTDGITWSGTFIPGTWDEEACFVKVEYYYDVVGNQGDVFFSNRFYVDSRAPILENVLFSDNAELPVNTNVASWLITGKAADNEPPFSQSLTIHVLVNASVENSWTTQPPYEDNSFATTITLEEGPNLVEVRVVDNAGNVGWVYNQTFLDTIPPTIPIVEPAEGAVVYVPRPTISARLIDPGAPENGLGIRSYELWLDDENIPFENLVWDENTGLLSYTPPERLAENEHTVKVKVSDSLNDNELTWTFNAAAPEYWAEVSISPSSKLGVIGDDLTYAVTVSNLGLVEDTFTLTIAETRDWGPTLSKNSMTIAVGESDTATLSVTIPADAISGARTTITVTATSEADPTTSGSATCTATVEKPPQVQTILIEFIPSGGAGVADFTPYEIPVLEVTITVGTLENDVAVAVEMLESVEVPAPPGVVHCYANIATNITHANVGGLLTRFRVSRSWVVQNDVDEGTIRVLKFENNEWRELSTERVDADENYLYFEASMEGLSLFAITGGKAAPTPILLIVLAVIAASACSVAVLWVRSKRRSRLKRARRVPKRRKKGKRRAT